MTRYLKLSVCLTAILTATSFAEDPGSPLTVPGSASSIIVRALD